MGGACSAYGGGGWCAQGVGREARGKDGEWRKLHNEELNDLYSLTNTVQVVKSRLRWVGHVERMGEEGGVHRVLVGKPEGKNGNGESEELNDLYSLPNIVRVVKSR
jgi:hypothetical protein